MQLNMIEQEILSTVHGLPMEKQREALNFTLFLKKNIRSDKQNEENRQNMTPFVFALEDFLKEVESDPLEIDTSVFDRDRPQESGRDIEL